MLIIRHNRAKPIINSINVSSDEFLNQQIIKLKQPVTPMVLSESLRSIVERICKKHNANVDDVLGKSRRVIVCEARFEIMQELHFKWKYEPSRLAHIFNLDLTSVKHMIGLRKESKVKYEVLRRRYS